MNFWFSAFILPKGCLAKIQSLCSSFLWSGDITKRGIPKVSWEICCLPKEEGGLGLRNLSVWNRTLCLRLIWNLYSSSSSLWADWISANRIRQSIFWEVEASTLSSWTWKAILSLRHTAAGLLKSNIGNGKSTSFWHDNWTPFGQLIKFIGPHGPRELGIPSEATVASVIRNGGWNLRPARSDEAVAFQIHLSTVNFPHPSAPDDEFLWCANDIELDHFSAKHTWESLRPRAPTQPWTANVWFKGAIPRHAFHFWITHLDRLPTRARLSMWGLQVQQSCCLCDQALEDRHHLFLRCEVSEHLWTLILRRLGYGRFFFHTWLAFVTWMGDRDSVTPLTLRRLASQATIYTIWT